ncbi:MAG: hypothetical protein EBY25_01115 [Betaproteobacteria bacterium]|nr:hypothetical protein [Betaproteobacteria bacterium]
MTKFLTAIVASMFLAGAAIAGSHGGAMKEEDKKKMEECKKADPAKMDAKMKADCEKLKAMK